MSEGAAGCALCALPAGRRPVHRAFGGVELSFCCSGCANVYAVLEESGLLAAGGDFRDSELYRRSLELGLISSSRSEVRRPPESTETREALYRLSGMWCGACGWLIEDAVRREYGVASAEVAFTSDLLRVTYCPQYLEPDRIPALVRSLGYGLEEFGSDRPQERRERRDLLLRLGLAGGLWMNVMLFSLVIYASYFEGISDWARRAVPFILMALATPAVLYSAWPILRLAVTGLRHGSIRMEALVATGILAAYGYSAAQAFLGGRHYYFDTACAIVTLVLAGKAMERGAKDRTARSVGMLYRLMPRKARLLHDGRERFVAVEALEPGMRIIVKPGERVPADGVVVEGDSPVDESVVTGESAPRRRGPGDEVIGGSVNTAGVLEIRVSRTGEDATLAGIVRAVERAIAGRTDLERSVDRVSRIFVPAVLSLAAVTLAAWLAAGLPAAEALMRAIAVLVIACPCALGIATPMATTAAIGAAAGRGVLIRDARVLETFRSVDLVILDKTGTVTEGAFHVLEAAIDDEALGFLAALESRSEHPLGRAVVAHAGDRRAEGDVRDVVARAGMGLEGTVAGRRVVAGSARLISESGLRLPPGLEAGAREWQARGMTVAFCAVDGEVRGALGLGDRVRPDARELVARLAERSVRTALISGDSPETTARVAALLGIDDARGGATPQEKAGLVSHYRGQGRVVTMVGDGINDAPALAAADLGIAMGSGTDLAMQAAPVVLMTDSLSRVVEAIDIARLTSRVVRQNLFWAFFYNAAAISLAVTGVLNPIFAAAAMMLSSLSVIANSLRLGRSVTGYSLRNTVTGSTRIARRAGASDAASATSKSSTATAQ